MNTAATAIPANDNAYAAFDSSSTPAKPRVHAIAGWHHSFAVTYRGVAAHLYGVTDSRRDGALVWWMVKMDDAEVSRGDTGESALGKWMAELDFRAEIERAKARKPGKARTVSGINTYGNGNLSATVVPNRSVRVVLEGRGATVDQTFAIGDRAEYDSFNLSYFGTIVSITDKTITLDSGRSKRHRLTIEQFARKNSEPIARKVKRNSEWSD